MYRTKILVGGVAVLVVLLLVGNVHRQAIAKKVWEITHNGTVAIALYPNADLAFDVGSYYFNTEGSGAYDLGIAQKFYQKTLELDPQAHLAWFELARIDFLKGNFSAALTEANKQILLHGDDPQAIYYLRGLIYGYSKDYKNAEQNLKLFLTWRPQSWAAHNDLAWVYFQEGSYEAALETTREGLRGAPDNAWLLNSEGIALLNLNRAAEAAMALTKAKAAAALLTPEDWSIAYPGNDPKAAAGALEQMRATIEQNLELAAVHK